jgi:YidC/Oxa1 family membrane protein insertase
VHVFLITVPIFSRAIDFVAQFIVFLGNATGGNLGVTIILFTLLIKLLLAPLTFKSIRSSKAMQDVAPIIKELQKKYKDDKQAFAQEQMKVYQQYGINPLAGCLPMLIQLPVFLIVYRAMLHVAQAWTGHKGFLWVTDLTQPEGIADPYRILVFLAFIFQVIQTRMSLPNRAKRAQQDRQTQMQSNLITFSAALVLVFGWNFLSAMVLYWAVQAVFSAVQQYFITGWGSLSDIFTFLPVKVEKPRELKPVPVKPPGRFQRLMMQAQTAQVDQQATRQGQQGSNGSSSSGEVKQQQFRPDGRPMRGSTIDISGNRKATPPQRVKTGDANGTDEANGTNRPAARSKGSQQRTTGKAIGASGTPGKPPPPVPRKSRQPASGGGNQTGDGGSE